MKSITTVALAVLLLASLAASSAAAQCKPYGSKIALEPTKDGERMGAIATAGLSRAEDCSELFGITVAGKMADGETLIVVVVSKSGTFQAGGITLFDGVGQLVLDSNADVSDVFPIDQLESIQVVQGGANKASTRATRRRMPPAVLLEGWF